MLSTMRENTKIIMVILAVAFVGWLVFDVGMGVSGNSQQATPDIGSVNGKPIRYQEWLEAANAALENARQQNPGVAFTREDQRQIEDGAFNALVEQRLLREEYRRRGISVSDREIGDAVRRYPPEEVMRDAQFQTEGQFDPQKYERFLQTTSASRPFLLAMEQRFRDELPRFKLFQQVTSDIYVSDGKLWTIWRDQHDSVTIRLMAVRPEQAVSDASVRVSPEDARAYYDEHRDEFDRPARAILSFLAISRLPSPVDSAAAHALARQLRDSILRGADFAEIARTESADSASRSEGGELPTFGRGQMVPPFEQAAFRQPVGQVGEPVVTAFGIHIIKVERRTSDSVHARHILIPIARTGARLDSLEAHADSLDRLAAEQTDPDALDSAAARMGLDIQHGPPMTQGVGYVLGRYRIPDVGIWAFEARVGETSPVIETSGAYYVFRLDSLRPEGIAPFEEVEMEATVAALRAKKRAAAEAIARDAERRLNSGQTLDQVSQALGLPVVTQGPFARTSTVPILGTATEAVGIAFRLRVGERSRMLSNDEAFYFVEPLRRIHADSAAWVQQKDQQRVSVLRGARQVRVQAFMDALRRSADVKDRRAEVLRPVPVEETP